MLYQNIYYLCIEKSLKTNQNRPIVLLIFGIRFYFFPNDHEPIHIYVEYQGKTAKIKVVPEIQLSENNGLKTQVIKRAIDAVAHYQDDIIREWNNVFKTDKK